MTAMMDILFITRDPLITSKKNDPAQRSLEMMPETALPEVTNRPTRGRATRWRIAAFGGKSRCKMLLLC